MKSVDSIVRKLTNITADLEAVIGRHQKDNENRDKKIASLEVEVRESVSEIARAKRISERINEFVS